MNGRKICIIFICYSAIIALMLTGCTTYKNTDAGALRDTSDKVTAVNTSSLDTASMFSDSDVNSEYDGGYEIMLSDNNIESTCDTLLISDSTVTVKDEGKGIKGSGNVIINGGVISIDSADDSVHSNGDIKISAGQLDLSTGDDGIHADMSVLITSADILVRESYEGIEGLAIDVQGENIDITSSDDGMNAAGGNDQSGFGGGSGHEISSDDDIYIKISGGNIKIDAGGKGDMPSNRDPGMQPGDRRSAMNHMF